MRGVYVLAAGVEGAAGLQLGEGPGTVRHVRGPAGQRGGGRGAGVEVSQGRGGGGSSHQQAHGPHGPGVAAVAVSEAVGHAVRRRHGRAAVGPPHTPCRKQSSVTGRAKLLWASVNTYDSHQASGLTLYCSFTTVLSTSISRLRPLHCLINL